MNHEIQVKAKNAFADYDRLQGHYQSFIAKHEEVIKAINSAKKIDADDNSITLEIIGIKIIIRFSMVYQNDTALGQVSTYVDNRTINPNQELDQIHAIWFDWHGNIKSSPDENGANNHVSYPECLHEYIDSIASTLRPSVYMQPKLPKRPGV